MESKVGQSFAEQVVIVTGASSGIGRAAALMLGARGAKVVLGALAASGGEAVAEAIRQAGGQACFVAIDVARAQDCEALVDAALGTYGRLDGAFNNAAIASPAKLLADEDEATWDRLMSVNLKGVFLCMKYQIAAMLGTGGGTIVNTSSIAGTVGKRSLAIYSAAKHGIIGLSKSAALDYAGAGIRINVLAPGGTLTALMDDVKDKPDVMRAINATYPVGRVADPVEIAEAALFMLSPVAPFMTGAVMMVDGGYTAQ